MTYPTEDLEKRIIRHMCKVLAEGGWLPFAVDDGGDEVEHVSTVEEVIDVVFAVEEAWVLFRKEERRHSVYLILGNGEDVVCDHTLSNKDDFGELMDRVMTETEGWGC